MNVRGIKVKIKKETKEFQTETLPMPKMLTIPLAQHIGAPLELLVKVGDQIEAGAKIADSSAAVSAPLHSPASGKITKITDFVMPNSIETKMISIETEPGDIWPLSEQEPSNKEEFLGLIRELGLVGIGGAAFPTHFKLATKDPIEMLVINAAECEPYITADYREMMENSDDIVYGIQSVLQYIGIPKAVIGIENNKPKAISLLRSKLASIPEIMVKELPAVYPQGAEKVLVYSATGKVIGDGALPSSVGVIVLNVSTVSFIGKAMKNAVPLTHKRITVDGDCIRQKKNVLAPIGTPLSELAEFCGGYTKEPSKIIMGGPMMGFSLVDDSFPVLKATNAVLFLSDQTAHISETTACINCGRCVRVCPVNLMPNFIERAYEARNSQELRELGISVCMECGCCAYVCPARRPLAQVNRLSKQYLKSVK